MRSDSLQFPQEIYPELIQSAPGVYSISPFLVKCETIPSENVICVLLVCSNSEQWTPLHNGNYDAQLLN